MKEGIRSSNRYSAIDRILLGVIIVTGAILRFYNYSNLPYSFDEFSALFRTRFDNFHDLIYYGVITTDTHPAGVQVFMYLWVKLFGESEMTVKFPFIIFGLLAILFVYKVGSLWFNKTVGLFAALFLSVLQYPITYSQFARPYASGLFFSLLMVWFWTHVVFYPERKKILNRVGFILAAAICAYNHHFSMFLAVLVGISGLLFVRKRGLLNYLLLSLCVIILYLPHLSILLAQINKGGVEDWLSKPSPGFIFDYFGYILHFSKLLVGVVIALIITSLILHSGKIAGSNKFRFLAFSWFAITYLVGYFYSVYRNAILQYSVLLFVFPFLILFVFSFYREVNGWIKIIITVLFITVSVYTLIDERRHYEIMYESAYEKIPAVAEKIRKEYPEKTISTVIFEPPKIREYYIQKYGIEDSAYFYPDTTVSFIQFRDYINRQTSDLLVLGWVNNPYYEYKLIAEEKYPYLIKKMNWFKGDLFLYSRTMPDTSYIDADPVLFSALNTFDTLRAGWEQVVFYYQLTNGVNYPQDKILVLNKDFAFSPHFKAKLGEITRSNTNEILISVDTYMPELFDPAIICEFRLKGKRIGWRSGNVIEFVDGPLKRLKAYLVVRLIDMKLDDPATEVLVYFWNRTPDPVYLDNFLIEVREGNPVFYALYEKF
jgi:hypothetical protein